MITLVPISIEAMVSLALISIVKMSIFWSFILPIDSKTTKAERLARLLETQFGFDSGCRGSSGELGMSGNQRPVFLQSPSPEIAVVTSSVTNLVKDTKRLSVLQVFLSSRSGRFAANQWYYRLTECQFRSSARSR